MKNPIIILLISCVVFTSCKKYEEGPMISLRSKTERLCGEWKLSEIYINETLIDNSTPGTWEFEKSGNCSRSYVDPYTQTENTITGTWSFNKDKSAVDIIMVIPSLNQTTNESWEILKLKEKALWLKSNMYGSIQEYRFSQ